MENKIYANIFKNMSYDTYKKLDKIGGVTSFAGVFYSIPAGMIDYPTLEHVIASCIFLTQMYFFNTNVFDGEKYTKDIKVITSLYNELIDRCVTLINELELNHPTEIYAIYNYMLHGGYLSEKGYFTPVTDNFDDIRSLLGVNVVTGEGVCRHIASMLNDIYNKMNFNSCTTTVYLDENQSSYEEINNLIKLAEQRLKEITNEEKKNEIRKLIISNKKLRNSYKAKFNPIAKNFGNHMVTLVSDENTSYIFDPSNRIIYKKDETIYNKNILKSPLISPLTGKIKLTRIHTNAKQKKEILLLPNSMKETDGLIVKCTNRLCQKNIDILENFSNENSELYKDITDKLIKVKKKKK